MMQTSFYHDTRRLSKDGTGPLLLKLTKKRKSVYLPVGIRLRPGQWDADGQRVVSHPERVMLTDFARKRKLDTDFALMSLESSRGWDGLTARETADILLGKASPGRADLFLPRFDSFAARKRGRTAGIYALTRRHILAFDPGAERLAFDDITVDWLSRFDSFLARTSPSRNSRNIHMRNIRAVFNDAIADDLGVRYPFRRFKIRPVPTRHRALTPEQLRTLFSCPVEEYAEIHLDMFRLMFLLMGINMVDLFGLKEMTPDGRIEYIRAKTGRKYSIKVEPEALEIINRHKGKKALLDIADRYGSHMDYLHHMNDALKKIGKVTYGRRGKKTVEPLFPELSSYWARHSWATAAASLDIPKETIAAGLGHGGNTVTDIYIDFDRTKVDRANRRVIDFVMYGR